MTLRVSGYVEAKSEKVFSARTFGVVTSMILRVEIFARLGGAMFNKVDVCVLEVVPTLEEPETSFYVLRTSTAVGLNSFTSHTLS